MLFIEVVKKVHELVPTMASTGKKGRKFGKGKTVSLNDFMAKEAIDLEKMNTSGMIKEHFDEKDIEGFDQGNLLKGIDNWSGVAQYIM